MQVILMEKVTNLGQLGDMVNVKPGYGRNFLIPRGKAVPATEANRKKFEERRADLERLAGETLSEAQARQARFDKQVITISAQSGEEGKLFGSIGTVDIVEALQKAGFEVNKQELRLPSGPIRTLGEHSVRLHLHPDVDAEIVISVIAM